jgi:hypothetical protein
LNLDAGLYFTDAESEAQGSLAYADANGHSASANNHVGAAPNAVAKSKVSAKANLGLPTASQAALAWHSDLHSTPVAKAESLLDAILAADAFQAATAWQADDEAIPFRFP